MRHEHSFVRHSPKREVSGVRRSLAANGSSEQTQSKTALIVLNMPIKATLPMSTTPQEEQKPPLSLFERLWNASDLRVCADGGANRLYDATILPWTNFMGQESLTEEQKQSNPYLPDVIIGDLDSIRDDVKQYYETFGGHRSRPPGSPSSRGIQHHSGCRIVRNPDQDSNDFDKSLAYIKAQQDEAMCQSSMDDLHHDTCYHKWNVYVYGAFDGRFDQTMASIHALYKWQNVFHSLVLYNEDTSARLLLPHVTNIITVHRDFEGPSCGLLPIGARCDKITTTGLKWNLSSSEDNDQPGSMEFGGLISTSNVVEGDTVTVTCSHPVVWTTEIKPLS